MKIINVFVNENSIELKNVDKIIENQVNNAKLIFSFDTSWEEYNKYVIFEDESNNIFKVAILNNEAIIPSGLNNGYISFQIYGYILKDNEIFNRNPSEISIFQLVKSLSPDGVDVKIPTADEWDNYIEQIEEITNKIVSDEANRVKAEDLRKESEEKREEFIENVKKSVEKGNFNGATFIPNVDDDGNISWNNDKGLDNPKSTNIKGPKGDTYEMQQSDFAKIVSDITDDANSAFNKNVGEKTESFDDNASSKTSDFNTNAADKATAFNTNYDSKLSSFNDNATDKTNSYNTNASEKLDSYNNNANNRLEEYNNNASELIGKVGEIEQALDIIIGETNIETYIEKIDEINGEVI